MINSEDQFDDCECSACKVIVGIQPNCFTITEECRRKLIDFDFIIEITEAGMCGFCSPCLDDLLDVYENGIRFLEKSMQEYEKQLQQKRDRKDLKNEMEQLEREKQECIEEEKSLVLILKNLAKREPLRIESYTTCESEELYWKEYFEYYCNIENEKYICKSSQVNYSRKLLIRIDETKRTINGFTLGDIQNRENLIEENNCGWGLCSLVLFFITNLMRDSRQPYPFKNTDLEIVPKGNISQIKHLDTTYNLFLQGENIDFIEPESANSFKKGTSLFFQLLDELCKHFVNHNSEKIKIESHLSILLGSEEKKNVGNLLNFPNMSNPTSVKIWNMAIVRVLLKLKLLQAYIPLSL